MSVFAASESDGSFLHDCGVEGVVGEIAGEVERGAAVFAVGVFQRGEQFRRLFFGVRAEDYSQTCGPDVLRHAGFAQGLGGGDGLAFPAAASRASRAT